ncbi:cytochrome c biogenesis protein CcsA [Caldinitratiruptor microaerophilus]|uniref:C-type cytochrome biogenesis protein CcsB n=1 Tax=Caldinitratiruptor microaerophilus TaxID=671077 RepID=A0AA35G836_9FIRM|nr:cytochrome c biogenesis protein CcsA [Caldinitratiruptor microaerophilus]BDG60018.1 c-type cytochrome biogenesis protein CcsB [Caldinitratiruptor microaerophilus]
MQSTWISLSFWLLGIAFFSYLVASIAYAAGVIGARRAAVVPALAGAGGPGAAAGTAWYRTAPELAFRLLTLGTAAHALGILARWQGAGHWPTSNMYEFVGFMAFTSMLAFQVLYRMYRLPALGTVVAPLAVVILAYAYVFPKEVKPLIPALQSYWLWLHVSTAALGEGFFAVAFGAALLYLVRTRDRAGRWGAAALEGVLWAILTLFAFTVLAYGLRNVAGMQWVFSLDGKTVLYHLPPVIGPAGAAVGEKGTLLGLPLPLVAAPAALKGKNLNTLLFSVLAGTLLYYALRGLLLRGRPLGEGFAGLVRGLDEDILDEVSYRAIAIGYPIFTLGGLVFAMIWAKEAWGRYWFWDPKETWAFITWLTYSGYLHLRINKGWAGRPSAWAAVLGFGVVLFTLIGVNLLIVGLHSYVGGD